LYCNSMCVFNLFPLVVNHLMGPRIYLVTPGRVKVGNQCFTGSYSICFGILHTDFEPVANIPLHTSALTICPTTLHEYVCV